MSWKTRTVVVEVSYTYFSTQNVVLHTENCKLELTRAWAKMHAKYVRQRNVRQNNAMDRAGTLPLYFNETEMVLKPVNLNTLKGEEKVPSESDKPPNSDEDVSFSPKS